MALRLLPCACGCVLAVSDLFDGPSVIDYLDGNLMQVLVQDHGKALWEESVIVEALILAEVQRQLQCVASLLCNSSI